MPKKTQQPAKAKKQSVTAVPAGAKAKPAGNAPEVAAERRRVPVTAKIQVLAKDNPRRAGTMAAKTFGLYKNGMTVGDFRQACKQAHCDANYLFSDQEHGWIRISE
jgi:hypothetical protein